tara:strand:- start:668 stop:961 length:294 start_codon:yes stop_codon:yes gene_type:complete
MTKLKKADDTAADINEVSKRSINIDGKKIFIDDYEGVEKALLEDMQLALTLKSKSVSILSILDFELLSILINKLLSYLAADFKASVKLGNEGNNNDS